MSEKIYRIAGKVINDKTKRGLPGLRVEAWDKDWLFDDWLGRAETDHDGSFSLEFCKSRFQEWFFDARPDLYFKIYRGGNLLWTTERSVLRNISSDMHTIVIEIGDETQPQPLPPDALTYSVQGKVSSPDSAGIGGLSVQIVDKNAGRDDFPLAETQTDALGHYRAAYQWPQGDKLKPDIQARLHAGEALLAVSEVRYAAAAQELNLDIALPAKVSALPSEYETLTAALAVYYSGNLKDLQESDNRRDITYLANKTGWDARAVAFAALADRFGQIHPKENEDKTIAPAFYYGLFRAGLPSEEQALFHTAVETVEQAWKKAVEQKVVPQTLEQGLAEALQTFRLLSAEKMLEAPALVGVSPIKEMLAASGLKEKRDDTDGPGEQQIFMSIYAEKRSDPNAFWKAVAEAFPDKVERLKLDGKLGFLTLNNVPLMTALRRQVGAENFTTPLQLAQHGYHRPETWQNLLAAVPTPSEIPGEGEEKRANYAQYLAAQVRLSYPTAALAEMVRYKVDGERHFLELNDAVRGEVHAFLLKHQERFHIGAQPIEQYLNTEESGSEKPSDDTLNEIKRLQRVYQITPNDQAMAGLLKHGLDSAYRVMHHDRETFIRLYADDIGGTALAELAYDKAAQVHNAVLNIAVSYLTAKTGIALGAMPIESRQTDTNAGGLMLQPEPAFGNVPAHEGLAAEVPANAADVIAYPTLEKLFGSMDYCACDHCRSILSPAAYLMDLLQFLDYGAKQWSDFCAQWKTDHGGASYPYAKTAWDKLPQAWKEEYIKKDPLPPLQVLTGRRPDIEHLPLSCENTNTALPYIDVVNETLEYFVVHGAPASPLQDYIGHDTDGVASEDLLASPQYVMESAYDILKAAVFPAPLPFHRCLENVRRFFGKFDVSLALAMEKLRKDDALERPAAADPAHPVEYGWRDVWMEQLGISRTEHAVLTDSNTVPLKQMYGFKNDLTSEQVITELSNAKAFSRRLNISYEDLVAMLKTRFINPNSELIPKLERLGVPFATLAKLKAGELSDADFDALLPQGALAPDPAEYGGSADAPKNDYAPIRAWIKDDENYVRIMSMIVLTDPSHLPGADGFIDDCKFDNLEFRRAEPIKAESDISTRLMPIEFVRLSRFIRLWKKLGWTIEQTDAAICTLLPPIQDKTLADILADFADLDAGFKNLLLRLGVLKRVMDVLNLKPDKDLLPLLACFAPINTHGANSLYRRMFLNPAILQQDEVFRDNGYGAFLQDNAPKLLCHTEALRSAFNLTADEFSLIAAALGFATVSETPYKHPQATLQQAILDAAPGIGYDDVAEKLKFAGCFDSETLAALKNIPGVDQNFKNALDALYTANQAALVPLTLDNASAIYRRGWLARKFKLSVREFLLLTAVTGLNPFDLSAPHESDAPPMLRIIELLQRLRATSVKPSEALYLLWNQDIGGKSAPRDGEITALARTLRTALTAIEDEYKVVDDPDGQLARARMSLVYGTETTELFFSFLDNTFVTEVPYSHQVPAPLLTRVAFSRGAVSLLTQVPYAHGQPVLEQAIIDTAPGLAYDDASKRLSFDGDLSPAIRDGLKAVADVSEQFKAAVDALYAENQLVQKAQLEQPIVDAAAELFYDNTAKQLCFAGALSAAARDNLKAASGSTAEFRNAVDRLYIENGIVVRANLEQTIASAAPDRIVYDNFRKRLGFAGVLSTATADKLTTVGISEEIVKKLVSKNEKVVLPLFADYSELQPLYDAYTFFLQLHSAVDYTHHQGELETSILEKASGRIFYDAGLKRLSYKGVLSAETRDALKQVANVTQAFRSAVEELFTANRTAIDALFIELPALDKQKNAYLEANDSAEKQRSLLLGSILPELIWRRKRQQAIQTISAAVQADAGFVTALLDDKAVLHAAGEPTISALYDFTAWEGAEPPIAGAWNGYLEVPENGFYNFAIAADAGASLTLSIAGAPVKMSQNNDRWSNDDPIELRAGTLYPFSLAVQPGNALAQIQWESKGRGREVIPGRYLYPALSMERLRAGYTRLRKVFALTTALKLSTGEFLYFAAHADYRLDHDGLNDKNGEAWLNRLPVADNLHLADAGEAAIAKNLNKSLSTVLNALLDYARIKAAISPDDDALLACLKDPAAATATTDSLLYAITRWEAGGLSALLARFGADVGGLGSFALFVRIYEAFELAKKMGIAPGALLAAVTNEPDGATVRALQAALRARYDADAWRDVIKPINDEMRRLQRDALVAYILQQMRANETTKHIDTPDKLFEYFLMDVQMEPCMQTSRIRHALSSVQLFIERCLMNLEPRVSPLAINPKQWQWMKRYRVWEANRKVFLYPENWLEPELRDNQSPFFRETMSELLQSDITEDSAATALLNYLAKLEEVAKLEPCGIHYVEDDPVTKAVDDISHVVARTAGAHRKYFYRRREYGYWTPWEQIKLDIEDNPVVPVVWKKRLFLFWLRILKEGPVKSEKPPEKNLTELNIGDLPKDPKITIKAILCWSEYYNGKWQATKTSDVNKPARLNDYAPDAFDRSKLRLSISATEDYLSIEISGQGSSSFRLYNTHSLPITREDITEWNPIVLFIGPSRRMDTVNNDFTIIYHAAYRFFSPGLDISRPVLNNPLSGQTTEPFHNLNTPWTTPFFYSDSHHVFYVTTTDVKPQWISDLTYSPITVAPQVISLPPLVVQTTPPPPGRPKFWGDGAPVDPFIAVADPAGIRRYVTEDAYIRQGISSLGSVSYDNVTIGPAGSVSNNRIEAK